MTCTFLNKFAFDYFQTVIVNHSLMQTVSIKLVLLEIAGATVQSVNKSFLRFRYIDCIIREETDSLATCSPLAIFILSGSIKRRRRFFSDSIRRVVMTVRTVVS